MWAITFVAMSPMRRRNQPPMQSTKPGKGSASKAKQNLKARLSDTSSKRSRANAATTESLERSLTQLHETLAHCNARIEAVEKRVRELSENADAAPSHADVMEVRLHSAKLAAELARATVELRGEIGMANDEARRAARMSRDIAADWHNQDLGELETRKPNSSSNASDTNDGDNKTNRGGWSASA